MTTEPLPAAADVTHLTEVLRRSGVLDNGFVCAVTVESSRATVLSRIIRLRLTYEGAGSQAPASLILKTGLPGRIGGGWNGGRREVAFYNQVAAAMLARLVPGCFEAAFDEDTQAWHLLLEDLTESHVVPSAWPLPPAMEACKAIVSARARFHAAWWDDPRLGTSVGTWLDNEAMAGNRRRFADMFAGFVDRVGDILPSDRRALYERWLDAEPRLLARYRSRRHLTIVQCDAHVWNCFLPRVGGDDVRLFDWDSWELGIAAGDLANMIALHWYPDRRQRMERPLLDHYHAVLAAHGVTGYDRRALDEDYRLSVLWHITVPVWQEANKIPPWIWWNNLEHILLAVDDLGCRDLLT